MASLWVPHLARGLALPNLLPLVDRALYPVDHCPAGPWDYWLFYREHFGGPRASSRRTWRRRSPASTEPLRARRSASQPSPPASAHREAGSARAAGRRRRPATRPAGPRRGSAEFRPLSLPVLFLHAAWDTVCDTVHSRLAEPMRDDCADLTEVVIKAGHELMLERPDEVNRAIATWVAGFG